MELDDGAHRLLAGVEPTADLKTAFDGTSWALLVGSIPRKAGMERGDLLSVNGGIFKPQGHAINDHAASDVRVLVVGNPCNTNCLIARSNAPDVPADRWYAMTRLDENRAKTQLAKKAGVHNSVSHQHDDLGQPLGHAVPRLRARADRRPSGARSDHRHRVAAGRVHRDGAEARRGGDREARAVVGGVGCARGDRLGEQRALRDPGDDWHSLAVTSTGEYGVPEGLQFGFPVRSDGTTTSVVEGLEHDDFAQAKIAATTQELLDERDEVRKLGLLGLTELDGLLVAAVHATRAASAARCCSQWALIERSTGWPSSSGRGVVVVHDDDVPLPRGQLLEVRADGLWAELVCEVPGVHWGFGLEAFGLRLDDSTRRAVAEIGDRVPVGLDLEWDEGRVVGEVWPGRGASRSTGAARSPRATRPRGTLSTWPSWSSRTGRNERRERCPALLSQVRSGCRAAAGCRRRGRRRPRRRCTCCDRCRTRCARCCRR